MMKTLFHRAKVARSKSVFTHNESDNEFSDDSDNEFSGDSDNEFSDDSDNEFSGDSLLGYSNSCEQAPDPKPQTLNATQGAGNILA